MERNRCKLGDGVFHNGRIMSIGRIVVNDLKGDKQLSHLFSRERTLFFGLALEIEWMIHDMWLRAKTRILDRIRSHALLGDKAQHPDCCGT
jgi:hypothetical protein